MININTTSLSKFNYVNKCKLTANSISRITTEGKPPLRKRNYWANLSQFDFIYFEMETLQLTKYPSFVFFILVSLAYN